MASFDVGVTVDMQEVLNAVDQAKKEIEHRYDFRGSKATIVLKQEEGKVEITAEDDMKIRALADIFKQKLAKRDVSLKSVEFKAAEKVGAGMTKQEVILKQDLSKDELKKLTKMVKDAKIKVSVSIQETQLRVSSKKRDLLQETMALLKSNAPEFDFEFGNFRD